MRTMLAMTATRSVRPPISTWGPAALEQLREARRRQQDAVAPQRAKWIRANGYYYGRLKRLLQFIIEPGTRVLGLRCETGQFLASVKPSYGVGVEISDAMAAAARQENPQLRFVKEPYRRILISVKRLITSSSVTFSTPLIFSGLSIVSGAIVHPGTRS